MKNFNKEAALFGALFGVALTLIIGLIGFTINISSQGDAYTAGKASTQGHYLIFAAIILIAGISIASGFIKRKKSN